MANSDRSMNQLADAGNIISVQKKSTMYRSSSADNLISVDKKSTLYRSHSAKNADSDRSVIVDISMQGFASRAESRYDGSHNSTDSDRSMIQLKKYLDNMNMEFPGCGTSAPIFRLHKVRYYDEGYYAPHVVSIGLYHFRKPELANMEKEKDEAMLRMERRVQKREMSMDSIIMFDIMPMLKTIKDFYGDETNYRGTELELARMATRDACFIYEFLLNFPRCAKAFKRSEEEISFSRKHSNIFDGLSVNPTMRNILVDLFLLENQIPGFILERLVEILMGSPDKAKRKLTVMMARMTRYSWTPLFTWSLSNGYLSASHLLEALYFNTVGPNESHSKEAYTVKQSQVFCLSYNYVPACLRKYTGWMNDIFRRPCMQCSCLKKYGGWINHIFRRPCMQGSRSTSGQESRLGFTKIPSISGEESRLGFTKIPSAVELNKAGVRFRVVHGRDTHNDQGIIEGAGILWIRFDPKSSTLYLPEMTIGAYDEYIIRNLISLEASSDKYVHKPMTVFARFMDELIDSEADAALLAEKGVINNVLGSNEQVSKLFNCIAQECRYRGGCKAIDDAKLGLLKYQRRKYKILWSQFVEAYFSKPWLVAGSIGAMLLLLMTSIQVFCLFYKCNCLFYRCNNSG